MKRITSNDDQKGVDTELKDVKNENAKDLKIVVEKIFNHHDSEIQNTRRPPSRDYRPEPVL